MFDWKDNGDFASWLESQSDDCGYAEACLRSVIGRAYYSIFCRVRDWLEKEVSSGRATWIYASRGRRLNLHERVWVTMMMRPDPDQRDLGFRGDALRRHRNKADYEISFRGDIQATAEEDVIEALELHGLFERCCP